MVGYEEDSDMLTSGEVARLLHLHINTVRRWGDNGIIEAQRIGRRRDRRFSLRDIARHLEELRLRG